MIRADNADASAFLLNSEEPHALPAHFSRRPPASTWQLLAAADDADRSRRARQPLACRGRATRVSEADRLLRNGESQQIRHVEGAGIAGFGRQLRLPVGLKRKV